jgi:hypothetical protein
MSEPGDEGDEIFSGPALKEDGSVSSTGIEPLMPEVPAPPRVPLAGTAKAPEPPVLEPLFDQNIAQAGQFHGVPRLDGAEVELAERAPRPPPDPEPGTASRFSGSVRAWRPWLVALILLGLCGVAAWAVLVKRMPLSAILSPSILEKLLPGQKRGDGKTEGDGKAGGDAPPAEKRIGTPAPALLIMSEPSGATVLVGGREVGRTPWAGDNVWPEGPLRVELRKAGYRSWAATTEGGAQRTIDATLRRR